MSNDDDPAPGAGGQQRDDVPDGPIGSEQAAATHLYALEPGEFIAARDLLVRSLRAAGNRPLAETVRGWRRPSVLAAELNRVLRADRSDLDRLLRAAEALRSGQQRILEGGTADLGSLRDAHRAAAAALAGRAARDGDEVRLTLEQASLDRAEHPRLLAASYTVPPTPAVGFDLLDTPGTRSAPPDRAAVAGAGIAATARNDGATPPPDRDAADRRQQERELAAAEAEVRAADAALHLARRRRDAVADLMEQAGRRITELEARLAEARDHQLDTGRRFEAAHRAVDDAERRLMTARTSAELLSRE